MTKKTFLAIKYWLTVILLLCCITGLQAQSGTYKNTTGVNGDASLGAVPVSDISFANYQFPMIGIALAATTPAIQSDGSYNITYTYTLKNYGGIVLTGVQVNADLGLTFGTPMTFTVQSISGSGIAGNSGFTGNGTTASKQLLAAGATLAPGANATVTVVINLKNNSTYGTFNASATASGTAGSGTVSDLSVNGSNPDANGNGVPLDDSSPTPVTIVRPDISVTKQVNTTTPYVGDNVTFTITVKNIGGDAVNVKLTEQPDAGFTFVSAAPSVGTYDGATKVWTIPQLNANATATLSYVMTVKATGPYTNLATGSHPEDNTPGNNSDSKTLTPKPSADVQITKTVSNTNPNVLTGVTYTLTAANAGPSDADNVVVKDVLPTGVEPTTPYPTGMTYDAASRTFTWNLGTMAAGTTQTQGIPTIVQADIDRTHFTNTATITTTDYDPKLSNNTSSVTIIPKEAVDLQVTKEVITTTNPIYPLDPVSFVIKVKNLGPNNCYDANVTDVLTNGYTFVKATPSQGAYTSGTGLWKIGTLLKDQEVTLTIDATITAKVNYGNTATISTTDNDSDPTNNTWSITAPPVKPRTDLQVTITPTGTQEVGNNISFAVVVKNNGPSPATGVVLENVILPAGYTFVSKNQAGYDKDAGTWSINNLAAGSSVTLTLVGTLLPNATNYDLNAHVYGVEDETTLTNNTAKTTMAVKQVADLAITKVVDNSAPEVGQSVKFTITVKNNGPSDASGVVITDNLPVGYTFTSNIPSKGTLVNGTWTIGTIANGATETLVIYGTVKPSAANYTNSVTMESTSKDPVSTNNTASVTPAVVQLADLSITKTINNPNPDAGSNVQFTLTATNTGPSDATSVVVSDLLPSGYKFVSASPALQYNDATGQWTIGALANGQSVTLTISATVKPTGSYKNTATISGAQKDPDLSHNSDFANPTVRPVADLKITKTVSNATPDEGSDVVYHLVAQNLGVSDATNVVVMDPLPIGVTYKPTAASAAYDKNSGSWNIGTLAAGASATLDITVTVGSNMHSSVISNYAIIGGTEYDPIPSNNSDMVTMVPVPVADLEVTKTVDNSTPDVGSNVTFTITATNHGISDASGVTVTDVLPDGYELVNSIPSTGSITNGIWTIGNMTNGANATMTIVAKVLASGNYNNQATITGNEADRNLTNNNRGVTPVPVRVADLIVTKTISTPTPDVGSNVTFTITATNAGPSTANAISVTDKLQSGYQFISASTLTGMYNNITGIWAIGTMNNGKTATLTITAKVLPTGDYNNQAVISSSVKDLDLKNNTDTIVTPVVRAVTDLALTKTVDKATADAGTQVTFTMVATNNGPSAATNVVVNDPLPTGFKFLSTSGAYDETTGVWTIGNLASGATQTLTITALVKPEGDYTNTAIISGQEFDPNTGNNTGTATVTRIAVTDLEVSKTVDNSTPDVGTNVIFTITATNHGASKATGVTVTDILQDGYDLVNNMPSIGSYTSGIWTIGDMEIDGTATLTITAKVRATGNYNNQATITGNEVDRDLTNNNRGVTPVPVPVANLSITKTISNSNPDAGSDVQFTLTATNDGPSDATQVHVLDLLPNGYTFVAATPAAAYNYVNGQWTIGNLNNGQTATLTISAKVRPAGYYKNTATIAGKEKDPDLSHNTDFVDPAIRPIADLQIKKTVSKSNPDEGTDVVYHLVAQNLGVSTATNVVVTDLLPSGVTYKPTAASAAYDKNTGTWNIGMLGAGTSTSIDITVTVNPNAGAAILNTANISGTEYDPNPSNNEDVVTIAPIPVTDLEVTKTVDNSTPDAGSNVTFTITAINHGACKATGVTVTDILQDGYDFVGSAPSTGSYTSGIWTIGDMEIDGTATLTITAKVRATGNYNNQATITGNEVDRDLTNNNRGVTPIPVPMANLSVAKTISNGTPDAGSNVTFTITATNHGPSEATNVTVTDLLKDGYQFISAIPAIGTYDNTTGVWTIGTMTNAQTTTLTITAKVLPTGNYNNEAVISSPVKDNDPTHNTDAITTPVVRAITDLTLSKTVDKGTTDAGTQVTFTMVATNNGPSAATNVVVNDPLPTGFKFLSTSGAYDETTGIWTIGNFASGATQTLSITALVKPEGDYTNTAVISGQEFDPNTSNNTGTATVTRIAVTDLEVSKTVDNSTPDAGSNVTFTITATNHGASKATGVTVTDILQDGYDFVGSAPSTGSYTSGIWTIGDIEIDSTATLTITAKVRATGNYNNQATITGNEVDRDLTNNNRGVTPVPVPVANLSVAKTISNGTPDAGSNVTFTITATNDGPSEATNVTVTDLLKDGYQFISATSAIGTYDNTTGVWSIGTMTNGQTTSLTITAKVLPTGNYNNEAVISSPVKDNDPTHNIDAIKTPVVRAVTDLTLTKTVDKATTDAGTQVTFTMVATNNGPSAATNVVVNDPLPTGFKFLSTSGAYDETTGVWTIGNLASGATQTLTITALVKPEGDYTNTAIISGQEFDPNTGNNTGTATVTRIAVTDLEVSKTVDNSTPDVGTNVIFTITATNHGASKATGVTVTDILQDGYDLVNNMPSIGSYTSGIWTIGDMEIDGTATLTITAKVRATGNYNNQATITGNEVDRDLTNNNRGVTPIPVPVANLSVAKTISNATPDAGSNVTFTITAHNDGPSEATNVTVTDLLKDGYKFISALPTVGTYDNTTGVWTIGTMANGQTTTLTITAMVKPEGNYNNTATIKGNEKDKTPTDDASSIVPPVPVPVADLSVTKTINNKVPGTGDIVSFKVVVKNNGPSTATGVTLTDVMQDGFSYQQSSVDKGSYYNGIWTIGSLAAGETVVLQIDAWVNTTGTYTNTATVIGNEKDPDNSNNTDHVTILPDPIVDLHVSKTASNMAPPHGSDINFTIIAGNDGPSNGTGVTVTDILPAGYSYKSYTATTGHYDDATGIWTIGNMAKGASATLTITVTVNKTGNYTNTAIIKGNETDRNLTDNKGEVTPVPVPLHTNDDNASTEEPTPVTIDVVKNDVYGNTGHTVFIKDKPLHGTVTDNGDGTVTYTPEAGFGGTDYFTYYIQDQSGFASNVSTVTIDVTKRLVDLSIKKVIVTPPAEIAVGKNVTFELTVTNNSSKGASGVVVTDILANNVGDSEIKTETNNGKEGYDPVTKTMSWKIDTLAPGQTVRLLVTAKLLSGGQVSNTATVAGKNADPDPDNNTATVSAPVKGADIFVPTAFTPNGDGINDKFVILGIDRYPNSQLIIWNRWGNVVYRSNDYRNGWDGSGLNEGTYYYELICPSNDGKISLKGWLQLVR